MKHYTKLFFTAAVAALGLASCAKEVAQVETPKDNLVTVHFGATAGIEGATKATLTPNEQETLFTSAWENGDVLGVKYYNDNMAEEQVVHATWNETSYSFSTALPEFTGRWIYRAAYPAPEADGSVEFGSSRTQKGNAYNSKYDLMRGSVMTEAPAGKTDDGKDIIFDMTRETAIAYFHFTSKLAEKVVSAKLSVTGGSIANSSVTTDYDNHFVFSDDKPLNEITITFEEGTAPDATDFKLWYNVLQTSYSSMTLEVETTGHKMTINRNSEGVYEAGRLYKVVKDIDDKWVAKGGFTSGDLVFDFKTVKPEGWPASKDKALAGTYKYAVNGVDYSFILGNGVYCAGTTPNSAYLIIAKSSSLGLPAIAGYKLTKVIGTLNNTGSPSTKAEICITDDSSVVPGGTAQTWDTKGKDYTYTLAETEENTVYYLSVSSTANCQMTKLVLSYEPATPSAPKYAVSFASVEGGTLSASAIKAEEGAEITLTAEPLLGYEFNNDWSVTATDGTVINVVDNKFTMPAQDVTVSGTFTSNIKYDHAGTENDPYNVLDVLKLIETLENGAKSSVINAKGVIKSITEVSTAYKNATYTIGDETTSETVTIYRGKYINGTDFTSTDQIKIGDEVVIKGRVTNYNGSKQFSTGSRIVSLKRIEPCATPVITIAEGGVVSIACETAGATIHYTVGDSPADPTEDDAVFSTVTLTEGQTIKAIAVAKDHKPSAVASKKYTAGGAALTENTATINFGTKKVNINKATITGDDSEKNSWTITTVGTTSFNPQPTYSQVGSRSSAATSITFTTTLPKDAEVTSISAKFGGFGGTAGTITLKVGETTVGTGELNETTDVTVKSTSTAAGNKVTITVTGIARGVKCYNIQVKYKTAN